MQHSCRWCMCKESFSISSGQVGNSNSTNGRLGVAEQMVCMIVPHQLEGHRLANTQTKNQTRQWTSIVLFYITQHVLCVLFGCMHLCLPVPVCPRIKPGCHLLIRPAGTVQQCHVGVLGSMHSQQQ